MHQIVYTSTASEDFANADLKKLLLGARTRNKALGVSGMLVFHDGTFLQALEDEKARRQRDLRQHPGAAAAATAGHPRTRLWR